MAYHIAAVKWDRTPINILTIIINIISPASRPAGMTTAINLDLSFFAFPAPLVWWSFSLFTIGSLVSGFCIGVIGVGGVLLVPMLLLLQVPAQVV